ncbi:MAG: Ca-activated chloride channel [Candidatus Sumerlaeota bacterium]|nr:Ca-activated chloride channel [Candidatus Sumerlaeota bacterium]
MLRSLFLLFAVVLAVLPSPAQSPADSPPSAGLLVLDPEGDSLHPAACPLVSTHVESSVFGLTARTVVRQEFVNTFDRSIEALYLFPLSANAAVDSMTMVIGERRITGVVKERQEAHRVYEKARAEGRRAALLDQHRPNVFAQKVANIPPGESVLVEITTVERLEWREGACEWVFPTVVGPRYVPGDDTEPPAAAQPAPGTATGETFSLRLDIFAAGPLGAIESPLHDIDVVRTDKRTARVTLANGTDVPDRDVIVRFETTGDEISDALYLHEDERGTFFTLVLQPARRTEPEAILPRELIFVIDASGSMDGAPLDKAKETMRLCIDTMGPDDTFNLLAFAGSTVRCFPDSVPNNGANRAAAHGYLDALRGEGGTEMKEAVQQALSAPADPGRLRIVCFMTDGYIGYDYDVIGEVRNNVENSRVFVFGVGNSVNRYLIEGMARAGRGDHQIVTRETDSAEAALRFLRRIQAPVLTDVAIDWGGLAVEDVCPAAIPDLFDEKPIVLYGRIAGNSAAAKTANIALTGNTPKGPTRRAITLPARKNNDRSPAIATLWARERIAELMNAFQDAQATASPDELKAEIIALSTRFSVLSQFTSFVAVEERLAIDPKTGLQVAVPATATSDPALIAGALAALLLALILGAWSRRDARIA